MTPMIVTHALGQLPLVNMTEQVNVQDAKTRLSSLLSRVERGEEIVIARGGTPVARLVPVEQAPPRPTGFVYGFDFPHDFFEPLSEEELRGWEGQ